MYLHQPHSHYEVHFLFPFSLSCDVRSIETESSRQAAEKASRGLAEDVKAPIGFVEVKQEDYFMRMGLLFFSPLLSSSSHLSSSLHMNYHASFALLTSIYP